jgi:hypothetical protein
MLDAPTSGTTVTVLDVVEFRIPFKIVNAPLVVAELYRKLKVNPITGKPGM